MVFGWSVGEKMDGMGCEYGWLGLAALLALWDSKPVCQTLTNYT
jgi:hypothetical protein